MINTYSLTAGGINSINTCGATFIAKVPSLVRGTEGGLRQAAHIL